MEGELLGCRGNAQDETPKGRPKCFHHGALRIDLVESKIYD